MAYKFKKDPDINVISKEEFESRVESVFDLIWQTLSRSFGPYGAPTIILDYPYSHVTKDGYTIMKNLMMDTSTTLVDQSIFNMASDICGRLNYSVGDGTTTAVIATNGIYRGYRNNKKSFKDKFILPRDISRKYDIIKNDIEQALRKRSRKVNSDDVEELYKNIREVVYISSNGDEVITNAISDLYKVLKYPAITSEIAQDGITSHHIIEGYKLNLALNDKLYINSDDMVMNINGVDILIFGVRITQDIYEKILCPINNACRVRGRHLIVAAPYYDETALNQVIRCDLNNEFKQRKDVNMILTTYQATSSYDRQLVDDFATLCDTMVIGRGMIGTIMKSLEEGESINNIIYLDEREIPNTTCICESYDESGNWSGYKEYTYKNGLVLDSLLKPVTKLTERSFPAGYIDNARLGLDTSVFKGFHYDEKKYQILKDSAYKEMKDLENKYQKLGTFNYEVSRAQKRYYSLGLQMGVISVGGSSELSQKMNKDTVDDAVLAAASAFEHGVVYGCNTSLLQAIDEISRDEKYDYLDKVLIQILYEGFSDVYHTVLRNAFDDMDLTANLDDIINTTTKFFGHDVGFDKDILWNVVEKVQMEHHDGHVTLHNVIREYGLAINKVFDVTTMTYSDNIINSTQTDLEVLTATIDLMGILISGNQLILTNRHNF